MNVKRSIIILLVTGFLFTLTGCGSDFKDPGAAGEENSILEMTTLIETYLQRLPFPYILNLI